MVEVLIAMSCKSVSPSGPIFLYQERSIRWEAIFCPLFSRLVVLGRCIRGLKYPKEEEKFRWGFCLG